MLTNFQYRDDMSIVNYFFPFREMIEVYLLNNNDMIIVKKIANVFTFSRVQRIHG
jgi:hypothetical protein